MNSRLRLRAIRRVQNLTQAQLAGLSGTSRQWISEAENNKLPLGVALVCRLVYELGYQIALVPASEQAPDLEAHLAGMVAEPARRLRGSRPTSLRTLWREA